MSAGGEAVLRGEAPAKLNLYLEVVGERPDGYHEIRTLFQTVTLHDDVEVEPTEAPGVSCETHGAALVLPEGVENLAARAAAAYLAAAGLPGGARLRLEKRIPVGGGLGGGSSDAAAVLRLLDGACREVATRSGRPIVDLAAVARALGSDVPFLLRGGTAQATGRGDAVRALPDAPDLAFVLIAPPFSTETAKVYARARERLRPAPCGGLAACRKALAAGDAVRLREAHHNDLATPAMRAYPDLLTFTSAVERRLRRPPCLSGSGSTLFDVPEADEVEDVVGRLAGLRARVEVVRTQRAFAT